MATEAQWKADQERWDQNRRGGRGSPPMRPRGGFLQRDARSNFDNVQFYKCQQMGHIASQCPQHPCHQGAGLMQYMTITSKKNPSKLRERWQNALLGIEPTNTWEKWQMKTTRSRMSSSRSSDLERILEVPEPNGLGEGFTL